MADMLLLYSYLNMQTQTCDVEDSREKLDRFFSYNFLFFDDDWLQLGSNMNVLYKLEFNK